MTFADCAFGAAATAQLDSIAMGGLACKRDLQRPPEPPWRLSEAAVVVVVVVVVVRLPSVGLERHLLHCIALDLFVVYT